MSLAARFWAKVDTSKDCWLWTGAKFKSGYGIISINCKHKRAHRIAYELQYGPFDQTLEVCHKCDNPLCVRPSHLFLGTHQENMDDAKAKGRLKSVAHLTKGIPKTQMQGEKHPNSKLTGAVVLKMRELRNQGRTYREISELFGIPWATAESAINKRTWKYLETAND